MHAPKKSIVLFLASASLILSSAYFFLASSYFLQQAATTITSSSPSSSVAGMAPRSHGRSLSLLSRFGLSKRQEAEEAEKPDPPKVDPVDPPGNQQCQPSPGSWYLDASEWAVRDAAEYFCETWANPPSHDPAQLPINRTLFTWHQAVHGFGVWELVRQRDNVEWEEGGYIKYQIPSKYPGNIQPDVFDYIIDRVEGCTPASPQNFSHPLHGHKCKHLLGTAWKECNNLGRGGSIVAGCLRYSTITRY